VKELHTVDLRESLTGTRVDSLYKYIDEIQPDAVIFLYASGYEQEKFAFD